MFALRPRTSFEPVRLIGAGGMGEVFLARWRHAGRSELVALKRPHRHLSRQREWVKRFEREARIGELLQHQNIVAVRATGSDRDGPYLALEYVDGWSLRQLSTAALAAQRPFPIDAACELALQLCRGLGYAHARPASPEGAGQGIVHRDVSPENVLVGRDGCAKLADFGLARLEGNGSTTGSGSVQGKFGYLAPELYEGHAADVRSDVFSLGATLYELFTGTRPFDGRTEAELLRATLFSVPVRMSALRPGVPSAVDDWVAAALSSDPTRRPAGVRSLEDVLAELVGSTPALKRFIEALEGEGAFAHVERSPTLAAEAAPRGAAWPRWALGAASVAAVGGVLVFFFVPRDTPAPSAPPVDVPAEVAAKPAPDEPSVAPGPEAVAVPPVHKRRPPVASVAVAGQLWVRVSPWAEVYVDGQYLGVTPMPAFSLPSGTHRVMLVNKELNAHRTLDVQLEPRKTKTLKVDLGAQGSP
ncbi:MAG: protein kinase [Archangiaceae bacterium]|nr:protein kinase [Archangiaceae bacterium]